MPGSREIEDKIRSRSETREIISAMKAFAGLTMRKTLGTIPSIREYEEEARNAMGNLALWFPETATLPLGSRKRIIITFGSDIGLCGAFNDRLADFIPAVTGEDDSIVVIGKKLREKLEIRGIPYREFLESASTVEGIGSAMLDTFTRISALYTEEEAPGLVLVFSSLSERNEPELIMENILPPETVLPAQPFRERPLLYLTPPGIFNIIMGELLYISLYRCFMESVRTENWFRLVSMESALQSIDSRISELNSLYRYSRQEEITEEIIEIIQSHSLSDGPGKEQ